MTGRWDDLKREHMTPERMAEVDAAAEAEAKATAYQPYYCPWGKCGTGGLRQCARSMGMCACCDRCRCKE